MFDPSDPSSFHARAMAGGTSARTCFLLALGGGAAALWVGHGLSILWPAFAGPRFAFGTAAGVAVLLAVASGIRRRHVEALALAAGAALGLVGMFVVGGWIAAGEFFMPPQWVLWSGPILLAAYSFAAAGATVASRAIFGARRSSPTGAA